jgi:hypothetical protein
MFSKSLRRDWGYSDFRSLTVNFEFVPSRIPLSPPDIDGKGFVEELQELH